MPAWNCGTFPARSIRELWGRWSLTPLLDDTQLHQHQRSVKHQPKQHIRVTGRGGAGRARTDDDQIMSPFPAKNMLRRNNFRRYCHHRAIGVPLDKPKWDDERTGLKKYE